jgi:protein O-GlcNAc transferase
MEPGMASTDARDALARGNLQKAETLCRMTLDRAPDNLDARALLAEIARRVGVDAMGIYPDHHPRYLLIKAWGAGFWADLDHVLGGLLLADLTRRVPVVHWGTNSRYRDRDTDNAFEVFFAPVSGAGLREIEAAETFFPAKWNRDTLRTEDLAKWSGPGSRMSSLYVLGRQEQVAVSDFHIRILDLLPWIPPGHPLHGATLTAVYRHLFKTHIRPRADILGAVDAIWTHRMAGRQWLAVHVRGTDKIRETPALWQVNRDYHGIIAQILRLNPRLGIFLLTDAQDIVADYATRYGDRVLTTDVVRGDGATGIHMQGEASTALGREVMIGSWLAARCDLFLGNGTSNVSTGIRHLKDWPENSFFLMTEDVLARRDLFLHNW